MSENSTYFSDIQCDTRLHERFLNCFGVAGSTRKYAPQFGGYCAYAVSQGYTARTVAEAWSVVDDKLYLNYSLGVRKRWKKDIAGHIAAANKNWPEVLN